MILINPATKEHLVKSFGLKADASDEEAQKLAATKFASGELTADKIKELSAVGAKDKAAELADTIATKTASAVSGALAGPLAAIADALKGKAAPEPEGKKEVVPEPEVDPNLEMFQKRMKEIEEKFESRLATVEQSPSKGFDILKLGAGLPKEDSPEGIRVKQVIERYSTATTKAVRNCKTTHADHKIVRRHGCMVNNSTCPRSWRRRSAPSGSNSWSAA